MAATATSDPAPAPGSSVHGPLAGRLAVVMITRNRVADTLRSLAELARLPDRPPVIVMDNASEDGTAAAVRRAHPSVRVIELEDNLGGAARNVGVREAGTPYVAFADDDSWWAPHSLTRAADILDAHRTVAAVTARTLVGEDEREDPLNAELAGSPLPAEPGLPGPRVLGFLGCATVVRTSAFLEAGGFEPRLVVGGEEELLACDLASRGWRLCYVPDLVVHHHPSPARDAHARRRAGIRNTLWFLWLRRPARSALRRTLYLARTVPRDSVSPGGFWDALRGAAWVWRRRRVVPRQVEEELRLLDMPQMTSDARRYVS